MRKATRALALCMALCIALGALPVAVSAKQYSDVSNSHWAAEKISQWSDLGYMQGYPDGTFRPDGDITRAEFVKITNNAFGFVGTGFVNFSDVTSAFWGYDEIRTASSMGYINGYPDGTFRPNGNITRQEAAKIICTILGLAENPTATYAFNDYTAIDEWARGYVGAVYANKIMGRYSDGTFKATQKLTRAECVDSLWNGVDLYSNRNVQDLAVTASSYVGTTGKRVKNLTVSYAGDVTIENLTIQGSVTLASNVADSTVTFKNCTIEGVLTLAYGNLVLDNVTLAALTLSGAKAGRTVTLKNATTVLTTQTDRTVTIDQSALTGTGSGVQLLNVGSSTAATAILKGGTFPKVVIGRRDQSIELVSGTITRLECEYTGLDVLLGQNTVLSYALLGATGAVIEGPGTVREAYLNARDATFQRTPDMLSGPYTSFTTTGDWRLSFTVTDAHSGMAVAGATVTLGSGWATAITNNSGYVQFNDVPDRDMVYTVTATDYKAATDTLKAADNNTHRAHTVALAPSGSWQATLTVLDSAGKGIPGAYACIYSTTGALVQTSTTSATYTSGGQKLSDGKIYFEELGSSTYTYKVYAPGYAASESHSFTINGKHNDSAGTVILYQNRVELRLYSSYDSTTQITSFQVRDPATNAWVASSPAGVVTFEGLSVGTYNLTIQLTGLDKDSYILDTPSTYTTTVRVTVTDSDYSGGVALKKATLTPNATFTYTVNVTNLDGSARVENATLKLQSALTGYSQTLSLNVNDGGRAYFTNVPMSKDYVLTVSASGYSSYSQADLAVDAANQTHQAQLTGLRTVILYVQDASGVAVQGMKVSLTATSTFATQTTDSAGRVTFTNVPEGTYTVTGEHAALQLPKNTRITVYDSVAQTLVAEGIQVTFTLRLQRGDSGTALPTYVTLVSRGTVKSYSQSGSGGIFTFTVPIGIYDIELPSGYTLTIKNDFINLAATADSAVISVLVNGT